jgi:hypothetical protein
MIFRFRIAPVGCWIALLAVPLRGEDMRPDFARLVPVALCPAAMQAARTNNIPIAGIDSPRDTNRLSPGDSITGSITLFEKGGRKTQWLLHVVAVEPTAAEKARTNRPPRIAYLGANDKVEFTYSQAPVNLRLLGPFTAGAGKAAKAQDQKVHLTLNEGFLGIGLDQAAAANHRILKNHLRGGFGAFARPMTEAEIVKGRKAMTDLQMSVAEGRALIGSDLALNSYADLVMETPGIDALFYKVVDLPSAWSLVRNVGIHVNLIIARKDMEPVEPATWNLAPQTPCYTYPIALKINDQPGMMVTFVVAPPHPPLLECGGIVAFLAEKPNDKETYMLLQIISARNGNQP